MKSLFNLVWDMYSAFTLVLMALIMIIINQVNPKAKRDESLPPPGTIAVLACWPPGPIDVDLWVNGPGQDKPVGYPPGLKSGKVWALLRDDLGTAGDDSPVNCENAFARITPAGEYVINLHGYSIPSPVMVHVEISINGTLLDKTDMEIRYKQERTVLRFKLDGQGKLIAGSENRVFKPLRSAGN
jgi:hypothetical protein